MTKPETIYHMRKFLLVLLLCLSGISVSCMGTLSQTEIEQPPNSEPVVILYSADWCWWCGKAEEFLIENKISYVKRDIENSKDRKELREIAKKLNYKRSLNVVPLFIVNETIIPGFQPLEVLAALETAKRKTH
jgi:glutaredoxin